jgi:hypothetical protein
MWFNERRLDSCPCSHLLTSMWFREPYVLSHGFSPTSWSPAIFMCFMLP